MHINSAFLAIAISATWVEAHGGAALPKIVGLNPRDLKARSLLSSLEARFTEVAKDHASALKSRQTGQACGAGVGSCPSGFCCSPDGVCGQDADSCYSPGCQYAYGPACAENTTPAGANTSSIARPQLGSISYGGNGIYSCTTPGTIAITFDDGPQKVYTSKILDVLDSYQAKATFFITGNNLNKGEIDTVPEFVSDIKRMDAAGHQIASHTWTHLDLSKISQLDRKQQMWKNEMALRNVVGKIPTYMRPPYSSCTGQCETDLADLGYHIVYFNVDTDDYEQDSPNLIQNSKNWFKGNITANGATAAAGAKWLEISHDIHEQTANNLTDYMLSTLTQLGYKAVTVGECLGDPPANWYRDASGSSSPASALPSSGTTTRASSAPSATSSRTISTDATCGGTNQYTCLGSAFGNCCSVNGYCGSTSDYCGTGCQTAFGTCGTSSAAPSSAVVAAVSTSRGPVSSLATRAATSSASSHAPTSSVSSLTPSKPSAGPGTGPGFGLGLLDPSRLISGLLDHI